MEVGTCPEALYPSGFGVVKREKIWDGWRESSSCFLCAETSGLIWGKSGFRRELMVEVRRGVYPHGDPRVLRDTQRATVTH